MRAPLVSLAAAVACMLAGCASEPFDYTLFRAHMPRSILVLPPLDASMEVGAGSAYLSTVTEPLAERGYYVFPVAVVEAILRENGLPTAGEMHGVSLAKIDEIFGADAVLYAKVTRWGTAYRVLDSATEVAVEASLVHVRTGTEIWRGSGYAVRSSSEGSSDLGGMLVAALVHQVASAAGDRSRDLAGDCNAVLFRNERDGLLLGPLHPEYVGQ